VVGALFRIQGQPVDVELRHLIAEVTLDERLGHEGQEVQRQEGLDTPRLHHRVRREIGVLVQVDSQQRR